MGKASGNSLGFMVRGNAYRVLVQPPRKQTIQMKTSRGYSLRTFMAMVSAIIIVFCRYSKPVKRLEGFDV